MRVPRRLITFAAVVIVLGGLLGGTFYQKKQQIEKAKADSAAGRVTSVPPGSTTSATAAFAAGVAIAVEGEKVVKDTLILYVSASGQAVPLRQVAISAEASGRIAWMGVRENDAVQQGQLVMQLDTTEFLMAIERAQNGLNSANASFRAVTIQDDMIKDAAVRASRDSAARIQSGLENAQLALRQAKMEFERTRVRAPFTGRVADMLAAPGQRVGAGTELFKLVEINPIRVEIQVLEADVGLLAPGRRARLTFSAYPNEEFAGIVETINPRVDQQTRTAKVTVSVPNQRGLLLPGMYARARVEARKFPNRIIIPRAAVLTRSNGDMVFVYNPKSETEGKAEWRYVTTGLGNDELVEIIEHPDTKMVAPGDIVLTGGHYTIAHDALVRIVEKARAAGGRPD
jgi:RND family efflux transporter MFP subunit